MTEAKEMHNISKLKRHHPEGGKKECKQSCLKYLLNLELWPFSCSSLFWLIIPLLRFLNGINNSTMLLALSQAAVKGESILKQVRVFTAHYITYYNFSYLLELNETKKFGLCILSMAHVKPCFYNLFNFFPFTLHLTCRAVFSLSRNVWIQGLWFFWSP